MIRYNSYDCASNRHELCKGTRGSDEDDHPLSCQCACHGQVSDRELEQRANASDDQFVDARQLLKEQARASNAKAGNHLDPPS
jgi:hypothetical protein